MKILNILFMGTPDFAVKSLDILIKNKYNIGAVITQPDRPKGRGKKLQPPPVKLRALEEGINVFQPERVKSIEAIEFLKDLNPDIIIVVAYGQILSKEVLELPDLGCINVHASLLPKYRGAAPINWCIIKGEKESGVTTMYMDEGLDTGDILLQESIGIGPHESAGQLHDRLAVIGAELLIKTLKDLNRNSLNRKTQEHSAATYAPPLDKDAGRINWNRDAQEIYNLIRGTDPWPGCYTLYRRRRMKIWAAKVLGDGNRGAPGEILEIEKEGLVVQTGGGKLLIKEIQMPSSRRMSVEEYLRGNPINIYSVLGE